MCTVYSLVYAQGCIQAHETLPNFIKSKHLRKGEKKKQTENPKPWSFSGKQTAQKRCAHTEVMEPLSTETST
jgi:hypothetical protein